MGSNLQNFEIILENIVSLELLRRGYKVCVGRVGEKEIDFIGEKAGDKLYYPKFVLYQEGSFKGTMNAFPPSASRTG